MKRTWEVWGNGAKKSLFAFSSNLEDKAGISKCIRGHPPVESNFLFYDLIPNPSIPSLICAFSNYAWGTPRPRQCHEWAPEFMFRAGGGREREGTEAFSRTSMEIKEWKIAPRNKPGKVMDILQKANIEKGSRTFFFEFVTFLMKVEQWEEAKLAKSGEGGGGRREMKEDNSEAEEGRVCSRKSQSSDLSIGSWC